MTKKKCLLLTISQVSHKNNLTGVCQTCSISVQTSFFFCMDIKICLSIQDATVLYRLMYKIKCSIMGTFESDCAFLSSLD